MNAPGNIVDSHRSLTGTCPECQTHKVLVGCGRCRTFMCYECMRGKHMPECEAALGPICDFCPSGHRLEDGQDHIIPAGDVARNPEAYADTLWELLGPDGQAEYMPFREQLRQRSLTMARTQYLPEGQKLFGHVDGTVTPVTLEYDGAMTDWGVCSKAFEAWTRRLAYYHSGAPTDAELIERMKDGEAGI